MHGQLLDGEWWLNAPVEVHVVLSETSELSIPTQELCDNLIIGYHVLLLLVVKSSTGVHQQITITTWYGTILLLIITRSITWSRTCPWRWID